VCDMDPRRQGLGTDHMPILTTLDISMPKKDKGVCRNFREADWDKFRKELEAQLCLIPDPCTLLDEVQFRRAIDDLTKALQQTIEAAVPLSRPSPPLTQMVEQRPVPAEERTEPARSQSYKYRAIDNHPSHSAHKATRGEYRDAIKHAKEQHWQGFSEEVRHGAVDGSSICHQPNRRWQVRPGSLRYRSQMRTGWSGA